MAGRNADHAAYLLARQQTLHRKAEESRAAQASRSFAVIRFDLSPAAREPLRKWRAARVNEALANAHKEMSHYVQREVVGALEERLGTVYPARAQTRANRPGRGFKGERGLRAAMTDPLMRMPRHGGWADGFTFGNLRVLNAKGAGRYWRVFERGGGPQGIMGYGVFIGADGLPTFSPPPINKRTVERLLQRAAREGASPRAAGRAYRELQAAQYGRRRGTGRFVSMSDAQLKGQYNPVAKRMEGGAWKRTGRPFPEWKGRPQLTAGATFSAAKVKGRPRYRLTIETRIKALHYFGWGAHRLRQLDKRAIYEKSFVEVGLRTPFNERVPGARPRMGLTSIRNEPGFRVTDILDFYRA